MPLCLLVLLSVPAMAATPIDQDSFRETVEAVLAEAGTPGSFVLYDENSDSFFRYDDERSRRPMVPASTFKILNSLIALEEGVVEDEDQTFRWDGVEREVAAWNADQTFASAFARSAVWVYQQIARDVGLGRMQYWLDAVGYGNGMVGGTVDRFWLDGPLAITPQQQVEFLRRLASGDLPFSRRSLEIVRGMLVRERRGAAVLRGKTGWAVSAEPQIGWFVGYLEIPDNTYSFALNVDIQPDGRGRDRVSMTRSILSSLGLWPEGGKSADVSGDGAGPDAGGCDGSPPFSRLDFWLGDWDVYSGDTLVGSNRIEKTLRGCAVLEHWTGAGGGRGLSLFYVDDGGRWRQVWVTENARRPGGIKEKVRQPMEAADAVRFQGEIRLPGGDSYLDRTTLTPLDDGRVRQLIEISRDGGETWETTFDAIYRPAGTRRGD